MHGSSRMLTGNSGGDRYRIRRSRRLMLLLTGPQMLTCMSGR